FTPETYEEVQAIVKLARHENIPFTLLGNGSNLIIKDGGIRGIGLYLGKLSDIRVDGTTIVAGSGARIIDVSQAALAHSLTGLEVACSLTGSVGGALYMNAEAYGSEIKGVLVSAKVVDRNGRILTLAAADLYLSYRTSKIPDKGYIFLEAAFGLQTGNYADIKAFMDYLTY